MNESSKTVITINAGDELRRKAYCQKLKIEIAAIAAMRMQEDVKSFVSGAIKEIMSNLSDTAVTQKVVADVLMIAQERLEYHIMAQIMKIVPEAKALVKICDYGNEMATIINIDYKIEGNNE